MSAHDIVRALGSKYSAEILEETDEPRSAQFLSDELDIPIATCYRRVDELAELDLLEVETGTSKNGRKTEMFRRNVDRIRIAFESGLTVSSDKRTNISETMDKIWDRTQNKTTSGNIGRSNRD